MSPLEQPLAPVIPFAPAGAEDTRPIVWICTPLRSFEGTGEMKRADFMKLAAHYREPIAQLAGDRTLPWQFQLCVVGGGGVARARNFIVAEARKAVKRPQRIFWVDYDLMPTAQDYVRVLATMDRTGLPVVGGLYTIRAENGHWVINFPSAHGTDNWGLLPVLELGTGFKCYEMSALDKIIEKNPWLEVLDDDHKNTQWAVFSMGPVKDSHWAPHSRWLTEDYWLDWLTRDAGLPVVVDANVRLRHLEELTGEIFPKEFPTIPARDEALLAAAQARHDAAQKSAEAPVAVEPALAATD